MTGPEAQGEAAAAGTEPRGRLVSFGGLLADLLVSVDVVPERGADVLAHGFTQTVGGGFAVLAAAARLGMRTALAGVLGDDPIADAARAALREEGTELLFPEPRAGSSGVCLVLVDAEGERTMVTVQGVESRVQSEDFDAVAVGPDDIVYLNGYELLYPHATGLINWLFRVRPGHLVFDPGPLIGEIDPEALETVLGATRWLSLNATEAAALTGETDPAAAAVAASRRIGAGTDGADGAATEGLGQGGEDGRSAPRGVVVRAGAEGCAALPQGGVVVRSGAEGCVALPHGGEPVAVPAFPAEAVDTTGAGDTHVGAFIAALARGLDPIEACRWANAAAAHVVAERGQVSPPRLDQLRAALESTA